jgi:pimeloyl-ACP methyl ester carboxylesterase
MGGGVPIVLFHMTASCSESFEPLMTAIAGKKSTIAFDTPNYGQSYRTQKTATMDYIVGVVLEALNGLGVERFHTLGVHTGASIAVELAVRAPHRVLSTTLCGLVYADPRENARRLRRRIVEMPISENGVQLMWAWTRIVKSDPGFVPAEVLHREVVATLAAESAWYWGYQAVYSYDAQAKVPKVKCPIFLVAAERDTLLKHHQRLTEARPDVRSITPKGHGNYYFQTGAEEFAPILLSFVDDVERSINGASPG